MNRTLQILGLLLVGLLSMEAKPVRAQQKDCKTHTSGCMTCTDDECIAWVCPIGHARGSGIKCPEE